MNTTLQIGDIVKVNSKSDMFCGQFGKIINISVNANNEGSITIKPFNSTRKSLILFSYKFDKVSDDEAMLLMLES